MELSALRKSLENGVIAFPITPFDDDLKLDLAGLRKNLEYMLNYDFRAIVAAGGTGEMYSLSLEEYKQVVETTVEVVGDQSTIIGGAGFGYAQTTEMSKIATNAGVDGILALPPNLVAWKDGQGDTRAYQHIINRLGDRFHWIGGIGDDCVPAYYSIGIRTYTSSIATVSPKISLKLHDLASEGKTAELMEYMAKYVSPIYEFRTFPPT